MTSDRSDVVEAILQNVLRAIPLTGIQQLAAAGRNAPTGRDAAASAINLYDFGMVSVTALINLARLAGSV